MPAELTEFDLCCQGVAEFLKQEYERGTTETNIHKIDGLLQVDFGQDGMAIVVVEEMFQRGYLYWTDSRMSHWRRKLGIAGDPSKFLILPTVREVISRGGDDSVIVAAKSLHEQNAERTTGPKTSPANESPVHGQQPGVKSSKAKGMSVVVAIRVAERHLERNPWPGNNALAKIVGCVPSTMSKAVKRSVALTKAKSDHENVPKSVKAKQWSDTAGSSAVTTDALPDLDDEVAADDVLTRLKAACRNDDREQLDAVPREKLHELAAIALTDPDTGKPLKKRKPR